jgi:hypothetical protein
MAVAPGIVSQRATPLTKGILLKPAFLFTGHPADEGYHGRPAKGGNSQPKNKKNRPDREIPFSWHGAALVSTVPGSNPSCLR